MIDIEQRHLDEARRQLLAEQDRQFDRLVRERAIKLQGEARRSEAAGPFDPAALKAKLDEMQVRQKALQARPGWDLSAVELDELDRLPARLAVLRGQLKAAA